MFNFYMLSCCFVLVLSYAPNVDISSLTKLNGLESSLKNKLVSECDACNTLATSFLKAVNQTNRNSFQGGDAAWESEKLGRYENSELRFVEIQELMCSEVTSGKDQCYNIAETHEEKIEEWFFNKRNKNEDFFNFFCINKLKVCCPENTYGPKCLPCPGGNKTPCSGHGKCKNAGTRKAPALCICNLGYSGDLCNQCDSGFFANDSLSCEKCDKSCKSHCRGPGPKNCEVCADDYNFDEISGCILQVDLNSVDMANKVENETNKDENALEHEFDNLTDVSSQVEHSEL